MGLLVISSIGPLVGITRGTVGVVLYFSFFVLDFLATLGVGAGGGAGTAAPPRVEVSDVVLYTSICSAWLPRLFLGPVARPQPRPGDRLFFVYSFSVSRVIILSMDMLFFPGLIDGSIVGSMLDGGSMGAVDGAWVVGVATECAILFKQGFVTDGGDGAMRVRAVVPMILPPGGAMGGLGVIVGARGAIVFLFFSDRLDDVVGVPKVVGVRGRFLPPVGGSTFYSLGFFVGLNAFVVARTATVVRATVVGSLWWSSYDVTGVGVTVGLAAMVPGLAPLFGMLLGGGAI